MNVVTEIHPQSNLEVREPTDPVGSEVSRERQNVVDAAAAEAGVDPKLYKTSPAKAVADNLPSEPNLPADHVEKPQPGEVVNPIVSKADPQPSTVIGEKVVQTPEKSRPEPTRIDTRPTSSTLELYRNRQMLRHTGQLLLEKHYRDSSRVGKMVTQVSNRKLSANAEPIPAENQSADDARLRIEKMDFPTLTKKDFELAS